MVHSTDTDASPCVVCGHRLRSAVFCPVCGEVVCSWTCYHRHLAEHHASPERNQVKGEFRGKEETESETRD
jgi:hypothetical protein